MYTKSPSLFWSMGALFFIGILPFHIYYPEVSTWKTTCTWLGVVMLTPFFVHTIWVGVATIQEEKHKQREQKADLDRENQKAQKMHQMYGELDASMQKDCHYPFFSCEGLAFPVNIRKDVFDVRKRYEIGYPTCPTCKRSTPACKKDVNGNVIIYCDNTDCSFTEPTRLAANSIADIMTFAQDQLNRIMWTMAKERGL